MAIIVSVTQTYRNTATASTTKSLTCARILDISASVGIGPGGITASTTNSVVTYDEGGVLPVKYYNTTVAATLITACNA